MVGKMDSHCQFSCLHDMHKINTSKNTSKTTFKHQSICGYRYIKIENKVSFPPNKNCNNCFIIHITSMGIISCITSSFLLQRHNEFASSTLKIKHLNLPFVFFITFSSKLSYSNRIIFQLESDNYLSIYISLGVK